MVEVVASAAVSALGGSAVLGTVGTFAVEAAATLAISAGTSLAISALSPKQVISQEGARLQKARVTSASEGETIPNLFGDFRLSGNIIWASRFKERVVTTTESVGGKGGGPEVRTTEYLYSVSLAVGLCEGEVDRIESLYFDGSEVNLEDYNYAFYKGTQTQNPDPTIESVEGAGNVPAYRGLCYLVFSDLELKDFGNRVPMISCVVSKKPQGESQTLQEVVEGLCTRAGLEPIDVDASDLSGIIVSGYYTEGLSTPREALEALASVYFFDPTDIGGVLTFRKRSTPTLHEVCLDDLVIGGSSTQGFEVVTKQEEDLPREVTFSFADPYKNYSLGTVSSEKIGSSTGPVASFGGLLSLNSGEARNRANIALKEVYNGKDTVRLSLPLVKYKGINCGDYISLEVRGYVFRLRVTAKEISKDLLLEAVSVGVRPSGADDSFTLYDSQEISNGSVVSVPDNTPTPTSLLFVDLPLLPSQSLGDFRPFVLAYQSPWFGGVNIFKEDGSGGHNLFTQVELPAAKGVTTTDLGKGVTDLWDVRNSVTVRLENPNDNLASLEDLSVLNGANTFAVLTPSGEWEVFQAANVELNPDGTYTLSRLLRGQLGTEYYMGEPTPSGSPFIVVEPTRFGILPITSGGIGIQQDLRYGPYGEPIDSDVYTDVSYTPKSTPFRPYAPSQLKEDYSGGDITLSWVRRSRFNGDSWDQVEVPLNEDQESYEVDILDGATVVRTLVTTTPNITYTSAQQTEDFGSQQTELDWKVYQMSSVYGRGTPAIG